MAGTKALENSGADDFIERLLSRNTKSWHSGQCQSEEKRIGKSRWICDDTAARATREAKAKEAGGFVASTDAY
jgi:hypothetical protein